MLLSIFSVVLIYKQDLKALRANWQLYGRDRSPKCRLIAGEERVMASVSDTQTLVDVILLFSKMTV